MYNIAIYRFYEILYKVITVLNYFKMNAVLTHSIFNQSKSNLNINLTSNVTNASCCFSYYTQSQFIYSKTKTSKMQNDSLTNAFQIYKFYKFAFDNF